ncbi:MAG: proline--tRNA ligase [Planctomycetota bacterium]|jgi:prolyl-tRNA synthetase
MRWSRTFVPTLKETPSDAEIPSHRLMIKAGLIRPLGAGAYTYLPLGYRSLRKAAQIVREEMDRAGAIEVHMPALHPLALWIETGRAPVMGDVLFKIKDRRGRDMTLGPTHEEVITDLARNELRSYRQMPVTFYQIQTKFRDEERPRAGVLRTREFLMKDAYSFDADQAGLDASYQAMYDAYVRIYERCGLVATPVEAESGAMGGTGSAEFMVVTPSGEDSLALCPKCGYAANSERCELPPVEEIEPGKGPRKRLDTPGVATVEKVCAFLKTKPRKLVKTLVYSVGGSETEGEGRGPEVIAVLVRGDHEVNEAKLARLFPGRTVALADDATVEKATGAPVGFAGPVGLEGVSEIIADHTIAAMKNFVTGANEGDAHFVGVNRGVDFEVSRYADLRVAVEGDPCPKCGEPLDVKRGIEVGHVFKLGTKYSVALGANFLGEDGKERPIIMGCYGIGVNRILAAAIEQNHDANGILWPRAIAPYEVAVLSLNAASEEVARVAEEAYEALGGAGVDVIYDDRDVRAGVKFKDADLVGFPVRVAVGEKSLAKGGVELKRRDSKDFEVVPPGEVVERVKALLGG